VSTPLHIKIDYLLTEARVILPGAQALLGFEFIVTMTKAFADLPHEVRVIHFVALACVLIAVLLLVAPGISLDIYVAAYKLGASEPLAALAAAITFLVLMTLWYAIPLLVGRS
jgi:hypothetical protein